MRSELCYVLLQVYVFALASKPRSVNVALETTFEFNNKQDVEIIEKVRNFLNKIENVVGKKLALRAGRVRDVKYEFRDFLEELITTLNSYDDNDFKEVFKTLYDEIRNQRNKKSKFNELLDNEDLRYIIFEVLNKINQAPVQLLRVRVKKFLRTLNSTRADNRNTNFINFFNFLYKRTPPKKFKKFLTKFKRYGERSAASELNLKDIIASTLNYLVYDHFNNLDDSIRHDVKAWLGSIRENSYFETTDKKLANKKRSKKYNTVKSITTKKRFKNSNKKLHTTIRKTFVTLYPEAIVFNTKKKLERISPVPLWKKHTVPNKNNFYLVRDSNPITDTVEDNVFDSEVANQSENTSSDSDNLEFIQRATDPRRKGSTKLTDHSENQQKETTHMLSQPVPSKSFTIEYFNTFKAQLPRRKTYTNDEHSSNEIHMKESASAKYLDRIKRIEEELNEMKKEIKAKISSTTNQYTTETTKLDEYKGFIGREEDIYPRKTSDIVSIERQYAVNISEHSHLRNETSKSDAVFRSDKFNNTKENDIFGDEFVLENGKEVTSVDVVHNTTIKPANSTLNINVSSNIVENSTIYTDHTPKTTEFTAPKTETVATALPVVRESDTKIMTDEVNIPKYITFTQMPVNVESGINTSKGFSSHSSTMGYVEPISLKL